MLTEATWETTGIGTRMDNDAKTTLPIVTLINTEELDEPTSCKSKKVAMPLASVTATSPLNSPNEYSSTFVFKRLPRGLLKPSHTKARSCMPAGAGMPLARSTRNVGAGNIRCSGVMLWGVALSRRIVPSKGGIVVVNLLEKTLGSSRATKTKLYVPVGDDPKSRAEKVTRPVEFEVLHRPDMATSQGRWLEIPRNEF